MLKLIFGATLFALSAPSGAFSAELRACFTPGEDCTAMIVRAVDDAKSELLIQAYGFTSAPIIQAVTRAKERGVSVRVILDKINEQKRYTAATYLKNHGIDPMIDFQPAIAHNKVMVIDRRNVITGSFNFTTAAQKRNAENVLIVLDGPAIAEAYAANWQRRSDAARPLRDFRQGPTPTDTSTD
ncbi:MAG: phospholipase D family protein [Xanthobacteraceae bacterium]|nr:phospholipase D family protein [Xanthobacteraceae bacterium]